MFLLSGLSWLIEWNHMCPRLFWKGGMMLRKERWRRIDTVKACTTVGGHSPVHTSPWLPSGLTCVWALSIAQSRWTNTQHAQSQAHTNRSACLSCKCRQVCRLSQQDFNTVLSCTHLHIFCKCTCKAATWAADLTDTSGIGRRRRRRFLLLKL